MKALTRTNQAITETSIKEFIEGLDVNEEIKKELRVITPHSVSYTHLDVYKRQSHYISRLPEGGSGGCSADVTIFSRGVGTAVKGES